MYDVRCTVALTDALMLNKLHRTDGEYLTSFIAHCASFAKAENEKEEEENQKQKKKKKKRICSI